MFKLCRRHVLGRCLGYSVHELLGGLLPRLDRLDSVYFMHGGLLLRNYRSFGGDWCMRGWLILGRVCIGVCELRGRHLLSCFLVVIVHELCGGNLSVDLRLDCMHGVYCGVLLRDDWTYCSDGCMCRG